MNEGVIDAMRPDDWPAVEAIYREGIATGLATFETETPSWERWDAAHRPDCRLVVRAGERVLGWAALSPVSDRCVYAGVAENSIYIAAAARGRGIGKALLRALVEASEAAGIFPENAASLALHQVCGFRIVGIRERIGQLHGTWKDVVFLERRSRVVGV